MIDLSKIKFGRLVVLKYDERNRKFPIRALLADTERARRSYTWASGVWLDQRDTPRCVGFAVATEAAISTVRVPYVTDATGDEMYFLAQKNDDIPGENYDGSDTIGAMKAGVIKGWYKRYHWAFGEEDVALAIGYKGPVILGIPWFTGMMEPDSEGNVKPTGILEGYHEIVAKGYNVTTKRYRWQNTWSKDWGAAGDCFVDQDDFAEILSQHGDAAIPDVRGYGVAA